jgi:O-antigen/teichoic acid export membrane protein
MTDQGRIHEGGHFRKYLKNTPWYLLSSLTTKAMGFVLIPLFTTYLSVEEFGTLSTIESLGRVLPIFISLYLDAAFNRFYYKERTVSETSVQSLFSSHFWFILFWGVAVCMIALTLFPYLTSDLSSVTLITFLIVVFTQLLNQLAIMVTLIWRANLLAKRLAIFQISISLIALFLTIYFLVVEKFGWEARVYALGGMAIFQFLVLLYFAILNKWLSFTIDFTMLARSLKFSLPLVPNIAAGWIAMFSDRLILAHFGKLSEVGLYSIAAQIAVLIYVINDAITKVQGPIAMSGLSDNIIEAKDNMAKFIIGYLTFCITFYLSLVLFSKELLVYFTNVNYAEAYLLVPILGAVYIFSGLYRVFVNVISFHNKTWMISAAAFIQAFVNIALNFIFIPDFGMYAAAYSTLFSMMAYTAFIFYSSQKLDKISLDYKAIYKLVVLACVFLLVIKFIENSFEVGALLFLIKLILLTLIIASSLSLASSRNFKNQIFQRLRNRSKKINNDKL